MSIGATIKVPAHLALIKFSGDPLVDIAGAYFPAWLACMLAGAAGAWVLAAAASRVGLGAIFRPAPVMLTATFVAITCGAWLLFFAAR